MPTPDTSQVPGPGDERTGGSEARSPAWDADREFVRAVMAGDPAAVESFVGRMNCIPRILDALAGRTGGFRSAEERRELAQEVFARVWAGLTRFQGRSTLETWVYRFCALTLVESRRTRSRRDSAPDESIATIPSPDRHGLDAADALHVQAAVARLDPDEAAIVEARHFEGATFEEAAAKLCISINTAKTRYYRAIERLRRTLRRGFAEDGVREAERSSSDAS
ncbi:MAG: RNA polymerase sigma factor [Planctomycetes bacterium]|nr:RNA polymerase sigma factor [Planctomycetota bacterium]